MAEFKSVVKQLFDAKSSIFWVMFTFCDKTPKLLGVGDSPLSSISTSTTGCILYIACKALLRDNASGGAKVRVAVIQYIDATVPRRVKQLELQTGNYVAALRLFPGYSVQLQSEDLYGLQAVLEEKMISCSGSFKPDFIEWGKGDNTTPLELATPATKPNPNVDSPSASISTPPPAPSNDDVSPLLIRLPRSSTPLFSPAKFVVSPTGHSPHSGNGVATPPERLPTPYPTL